MKKPNPITASQAAKEKGVSSRHIRKFCDDGRIPGAEKLENGMWLLPNPFRILPPANPHLGRPSMLEISKK